MIPESSFQVIEEHLTVVEQLAIEVRQTSDSATNDAINSIAHLFDDTVKAIRPFLSLVGSEQVSLRKSSSPYYSEVFRVIRLKVGPYKLRYIDVQDLFENLLITSDGKKVSFPDKRASVSDPWYFVYYDLGGDVEDRLKFYLSFLSAIREFLSSNSEAIIAANKNLDEVLDRLKAAQNIFETASN